MQVLAYSILSNWLTLSNLIYPYSLFKNRGIPLKSTYLLQVRYDTFTTEDTTDDILTRVW